ncbi:hypothetical protein KPL71_025181 [Citrus sinensis]|uniref:Uncharacterized protein n=1 Tax=Citrus sinensis TaxID=2711 RepID=A0ACB8J0E5_CITSI|nr:hypothetical protein KPL71_025181 [Citrus sinensis]
MVLTGGVLGVKSSILGIAAENRKVHPEFHRLQQELSLGTYSSDSTIILGFLSIVALTASVVLLPMLAVGMLFWPTLAELIHRTRHVHHNMSTIRPTAKTGLFGGAAFMALNASLFWLICVILADNARDDYFDEEDQNHKCEYGQVFTTDYDAKGQGDV